MGCLFKLKFVVLNNQLNDPCIGAEIVRLLALIPEPR